MRYTHILLAIGLLLTFSACKKHHTDTISNTWQYKSNTYQVVKTERNNGFGTYVLNAYSDTVNQFSRQGITLTFTGFPTASATYRMVEYPQAADEVGVYVWDNTNIANNYYSSSQTPGIARVYVVNGRMLISISNAWVKQATFMNPDSTLLNASFIEK